MLHAKDADNLTYATQAETGHVTISALQNGFWPEINPSSVHVISLQVVQVVIFD